MNMVMTVMKSRNTCTSLRIRKIFP